MSPRQAEEVAAVAACADFLQCLPGKALAEATDPKIGYFNNPRFIVAGQNQTDSQ